MRDKGAPLDGPADAVRGQGPVVVPVRTLIAEALERRAAGQGEGVRRVLDAKVAALREHDGNTATPSTPPATLPLHTALGDLRDHIAEQIAVRDGEQLAAGEPPRPPFPEVAMLADLRRLWSRIRAESQLRESLETAPADAGPLNSGRLVHRSLTLMREQSPGYLQSFLSYLDALAWLEQMSDGGLLATGEAPRAATETKRPRKPRKRRE
nr:DUF2894 domain-containing protein [Pseudoxanthomonas sp.]